MSASHFNVFPHDYILICPTRRQMRFAPWQSPSIMDFFDSKHDDGTQQDSMTWLLKMLATPLNETQQPQHYHPKALEPKEINLLERLPVELIAVIIDQLLMKNKHGYRAPHQHEYVLALALSTPHMYSKVLAWAHRMYARDMASSWAGEKIGFHGGKSCFNQSQLENYGIANDPSWSSRDHIQFWPWTRVFDQPEWGYMTAVSSQRKRAKWNIPAPDWDMIKHDFSQLGSYPRDETWVLRNLTTHEYVRSDQLVPSENETNEPNEASSSTTPKLKKAWNDVKQSVKGDTKIVIPQSTPAENTVDPIILPQIFLLMTAYSTLDRINLDERPLLFQDGPWNGHAFDLVTLSEHQASLTDTTNNQSSESWTNVTAPIVRDVYNLRDCLRYTNDWKAPRKSWRGEFEPYTKVVNAIVQSRKENRVWPERRYRSSE